MRLVSERGERWVSASDFFLGPLMTDVKEDELLVECRWQRAPERTGAAVMELALRHGDYALVGVAAQVTVDGDGTIEQARLALFGVGGTPVRPLEAEQLLVGVKGKRPIQEAAGAAAESCDPSSDPAASGDYRREMVAVYCRRALEQAHARAAERGVLTL
jgi:carbon-monoxide dehydrogenase medium subunit